MTPAAIRAAREAAGLTQAALADLMRVGQAHVAKWEAGRYVPTGPAAAMLEAVLLHGYRPPVSDAEAAPEAGTG